MLANTNYFLFAADVKCDRHLCHVTGSDNAQPVCLYICQMITFESPGVTMTWEVRICTSSVSLGNTGQAHIGSR